MLLFAGAALGIVTGRVRVGHDSIPWSWAVVGSRGHELEVYVWAKLSTGGRQRDDALASARCLPRDSATFPSVCRLGAAAMIADGHRGRATRSPLRGLVTVLHQADRQVGIVSGSCREKSLDSLTLERVRHVAV